MKNPYHYAIKTERYPSNIKNKTTMHTLATLIQHCIRIPSQSNQAVKKLKGIQIVEKEIKVSLFVDDMILYKENPKDSIKNY